MMLRFLFCALFLLTGLLAPAQLPMPSTLGKAMTTPEVSIAPPNEPVEIGERVELRAVVNREGEYEDLQLTFPADQSGAIVVERVRKTGPASFTVTARPIRSGEVEFSPTVQARPVGGAVVELQAVPFVINVKPPEEEVSTELPPFTPPRSLPFDYTWRNLVYALAGLLALGILVALAMLVIWLSRRREANRPSAPLTPPVESALLAVRNLKRLDIFVKVGPNEHYTMLSNTMRRYLEEQFQIPALEMTEDEVVEFLERELANWRSTEPLGQVFKRSSMAKFARQPLTEEVARRDCEISEEFLLSEKERIALEQKREEQMAATASERKAA